MKGLRIIRYLVLGFLALLLIGWFTGPVGYALQKWLPGRMPFQADEEFRMDSISYADEHPGHDDRIYFTISQHRLHEVLRDASVFSLLLPRGLFRDGLVIEAAWIPWKRDRTTRIKAPMGVEIPVAVVIADTPGDHPHLTGRIPAPLLTQYLAKEFERDFKEEREEWELGHYAYEFLPDVVSCRLYTTNEIGVPPEQYAERIYLDLDAYAKVTMKFEENIGSLNADGDLALRVHGQLYTKEFADGLSPRYVANFRNVDANIKGMNNLIDEKVSDKLKKKWHTSLNKDKRRNRLAEKRIPRWFPTDLVVDLEFYSE